VKPLGDRIQVVALCGTNQEAKEKLTQWVEQNVTFPVRLLGFTNEMPRLLQVVSTVVARAGATTAGEALLCRCPVIFNALGGIMPQEMPTWRYFRKYKVGALAYRSQTIVQILKTWLEQEEILVAMRARLDTLRDDTTPEEGLRCLLKD
jgi:processive 1,2-diacylglycerol beta-glucosyltransferase